MALEKSATRPPASVKRPSPNSCKSKSKNDGSAFSTSSKRTTAKGCSRILAVSWPSVAPTPPMSRLTARGSAYSLMSKRSKRLRSRKKNSASAFAISVLPTPVGPMNKSDAMGRRGRVRPAFTVAIKSVTSRTASVCPITRAASQASVAATSSGVSSSNSSKGKPVSAEKAATTSRSDLGFGVWDLGFGASLSNKFLRKRRGRPGKAE